MPAFDAGIFYALKGREFWPKHARRWRRRLVGTAAMLVATHATDFDGVVIPIHRIARYLPLP